MEGKAALAAVISVVFVTVLVGCTLSQQTLEERPDAESQNFPESYEVIYQRLSAMGERCYPRGMDGGNVGNRFAGSIESQGEMHREGGFAEFRLVTSMLGLKTNYFLAARIEKAGTGSRVTTKAINSLGASALSKIVFR